MTALKVIGIILLILLLLALVRVGAEVSFGEETVVRLRIGPFRKTIRPGSRKQLKEPKKTEKKDKPAAKKSQKERSLPKPDRQEIMELISLALSTLRRALHGLCRRVRIDPLEVFIAFGGNDPADIAQQYGYASAAMWTLMPHAEELFNIPHPSLHLRMDYSAAQTRTEGTVGVSVRIGSVAAIGFTLAVPMLRWFLRFRKTHAQNKAAPEQQKKTEKQEEKLTA